MYSVPDFRVNSSIDDVGRDEVTNDQSYRGAPPILCEPEFHGSGKSNLLEGKIFILDLKETAVEFTTQHKKFKSNKNTLTMKLFEISCCAY